MVIGKTKKRKEVERLSAMGMGIVMGDGKV